jgi:amidase
MSVVLCPATPTPTFPHDHTPMATRELDIDGQKRSYFDQLVWAGPATLNGLLVTTAPIRRTDTGLPIGVSIIDGFLDDRTTIAFAGMVAREFGGLTPPRCCNRPTRRRPGTTAAAAGVD